MSLLLRCPLCRESSTEIQFVRSHRGPYEIHVTAFHRDASACRGYLTPANAAAALTAKATTQSVRIQPAPRSGT